MIRPEPTYKTLQKRFAATVKDAHAHGLTSVHDAGFNPISLEFFRRYAASLLPCALSVTLTNDRAPEKRTQVFFR